MESIEILYLGCYGGFAVSLFGILLFYGLKRKEVLNPKTAMLPLGMFINGVGIILMGSGAIASMSYLFIIGLTVMVIGFVLFFIWSVQYLWCLWKNRPQPEM